MGCKIAHENLYRRESNMFSATYETTLGWVGIVIGRKTVHFGMMYPEFVQKECIYVYEGLPEGQGLPQYVWSTSPKNRGRSWFIGQGDTLDQIATEFLALRSDKKDPQVVVWRKPDTIFAGSAEFWDEEKIAAFRMAMAGSGGNLHISNQVRGARLYEDRPDPDGLPVMPSTPGIVGKICVQTVSGGYPENDTSRTLSLLSDELLQEEIRLAYAYFTPWHRLLRFSAFHEAIEMLDAALSEAMLRGLPIDVNDKGACFYSEHGLFIRLSGERKNFLIWGAAFGTMIPKDVFENEIYYQTTQFGEDVPTGRYDTASGKGDVVALYEHLVALGFEPHQHGVLDELPGEPRRKSLVSG